MITKKCNVCQISYLRTENPYSVCVFCQVGKCAGDYVSPPPKK